MPKGYSKRNQSGWKHKKKSTDLMTKNRAGITANEKNPRWVGEKVSYAALHNWIRRHFIKPSFCEYCGKFPGHDKRGHIKLQWANKTGKYLREENDWICLCPSCHRKEDFKNKKKHRYAK